MDNELSEEQKQLIVNAWNNAPKDSPPSLKDLVQICFGGEHDGRSGEAKAVKKFLAEKHIKARVSYEYQPKATIELSEEAKEYIINHCSSMTAVEIARVLFNKKDLTILHNESRTVTNFIKTLESKILYQNPSIIPETNYRPPKTIKQSMDLVNKYILNCLDPKIAEKDAKIQNCLKSLVRFCHMYRFVVIINNFSSAMDRELFEASYVRFIWNKPDLTEEELDAYVNLCCDIVNYTNMQRELDGLKEMRDQCLNDTDGKRISLSIVESITSIRKEMDDNQKRQNKLMENLQGKRNERLDFKVKENASILQLIEAWRDEQERQRLIRFAEDRKKSVKEEIQRMDTLDQFKCEIFGLNRESFDLEPMGPSDKGP